jgi:hypothetical protein
VVDFVVSVVEVDGGVDGVVTTVVLEVEVSGAFSFTTVVEVDVPELAGVVETSVLQPARPRASRRATA